jgi:hypothetical protein|tara:strand:+ start:8033 stop:10885 length:2853 start_codon:yes stop_codon:yes gene_type:complete
MDEFDKNLSKSEMYENNDLYASMSMEPPENFKELNADINFQDGTISTVGVDEDDLPFLLKTEKSDLIQELKNKVDNNEKIEPSFLNKMGGIVEGFKSWTMSAPLSDYNIAIDKASLQIGDSITQFNKLITGGTIGKLFDNQPRIFRLSQEGKADITIRATNSEVDEQFYNMSAEFRKFGKYHPFDDNGELKEGWQEITEFVATSDEIEYTNKNFTPAPFLEYGLAYGVPGVGFYKGLGQFETFKKFPMWIQVLLAETGVEFAMASQKKDDVNLGNLFKAFGIGDIDETTPEFLRGETSLMTKYINLFRESVAADLDDTAFERKWKNASGNAPIGVGLGLVLQFFKMAKKFKYNKKGREEVATNVDQEVVVDKGMDGEYKVYDQNGLETGGFKTQEEADEFAETLGEGFEAKSLGAAATPNEAPTLVQVVDSSGQVIKQADELVPSEKPFYSNVEKAISNMTMKSGNGDQLLATLINTPGIKKSEIEDLGLNEFLAGKKKVTKEELDDFIADKSLTTKVKDEILDTEGKEQLDFFIDDKAPEVLKKAKSKEEAFEIFMNELDDPALFKEFEDYKQAEIKAGNIVNNLEHVTNFLGDKFKMMDVKQNKIPTKFDSYVTPGGDNYKEMLITAPGTPQVFTDHHYRGEVPPGENLIAHARFNDRTIDGKKILFIEEIQSDLHQRGRKKGYKGVPFNADQKYRLDLMKQRELELKKEYGDKLTDTILFTDPQYKDLISAIDDILPQGVDFKTPNAPFKKNWYELTMKRLIKYAIDNGYDGISFTSGDIQVKRYPGAPNPEGLKGFYDNTLTAFTSKFGKKYGAKLEKKSTPFVHDYLYDRTDFSPGNNYTAIGNNGTEFATYKFYEEKSLITGFNDLVVEQIKNGKTTQIYRGDEFTDATRILSDELEGFTVPEILGDRKMPFMLFTPEMKKEILTEGVPIAQVEDQQEKNTALV